MTRTGKMSRYTAVRYEIERWPLWRWDMNLRYLARSVAHRRNFATAADALHWGRVRAWLRDRAWPDAQEEDVSIAGVGDMMWLRDGYDTFASPGVAALLRAPDLVLGNLETPIDTSAPVKRRVYETLHYNAPPEYLSALRRARGEGPIALSLCNNHALDQGMGGLRRTRELVCAHDMACLGGANAREQAVTHVTIPCAGDEDGARGLRVAVISLTFGINHVEEHPEPPAGVPIITFGDARAPVDWAEVDALIAIARRTPHDLLVCMAHWGYEYEYWPDAAMRADAASLVQRGVDVVLGTSPHVLQPVEVVSINGWDASCPTQITRDASDGATGAPRAGLIAYSLGNFGTIMPTVACQVGAVLHATWRTRADAPPELVGLRADPTVCMRALGDHWLDTRVCTLDEYTTRPRRDRPAAAYRRHARAMLDALMPDAT